MEHFSLRSQIDHFGVKKHPSFLLQCFGVSLLDCRVSMQEIPEHDDDAALKCYTGGHDCQVRERTQRGNLSLEMVVKQRLFPVVQL